MTELLNQAQDLLKAARAAGADSADAVLVASDSLGVQRRLGKTEETERAESRELGLRVFVGQQSAIVSASAIDPAGFARLAEQAVAMARVVPEDIYAFIPEAPPALDDALLDMNDPVEPSMEVLIERAAKAEEAAMAVPGITNSEGGSAGWSRSQVVLVTSLGFAGHYKRSSHSVSVSAIAGAGTAMQRDYDYSSAVHAADLDDPAKIGAKAAAQALARLNPARPKTAQLPVLFHPRVSGGLVSALAGAINGGSIARKTSFLKEKMGARIFAPGVFIYDDPFRVRGFRSRMFDGEGQRGEKRALIEDGVLTSWILDSRTAKQLGLKSTGHAARGTGGPPGPSATNLYMAPGSMSPDELMADIAEGLFITEMMGGGVNGITGDYSRGASGFMIRHGKIAEPVAEFTIAGHALAMFANLTPANDLEFKRGTDAPTIRVEGLTLAGG
ncbi:MAG: modulator protein [Acidocella sp. 20-57-95]|nr:MAG: modulator protein [Acidocella sp. 20-57-95]OYV59438.1 MAG: modulator protein [Acidocella sp. 21-58-7]HQT63197.1 TldD/PmbA family protein [Acidocella sp.]HQU04811.1 TldD/PmbA family protein [Acidocella sp.]